MAVSRASIRRHYSGLNAPGQRRRSKRVLSGSAKCEVPSGKWWQCITRPNPAALHDTRQSTPSLRRCVAPLARASRSSAVPARPDDRTIVHVLNRAAFGPRPGDVAQRPADWARGVDRSAAAAGADSG